MLLPNGVVVEVPEHTERTMCATVLGGRETGLGAYFAKHGSPL